MPARPEIVQHQTGGTFAEEASWLRRFYNDSFPPPAAWTRLQHLLCERLCAQPRQSLHPRPYRSSGAFPSSTSALQAPAPTVSIPRRQRVVSSKPAKTAAPAPVASAIAAPTPAAPQRRHRRPAAKIEAPVPAPAPKPAAVALQLPAPPPADRRRDRAPPQGRRHAGEGESGARRAAVPLRARSSTTSRSATRSTRTWWRP